MSTVYIQSDKDPNLRFEVVSYNAETKTARLRGKHSSFEIKPFTKEKLAADGYRLVRDEGDHGQGAAG